MLLGSHGRAVGPCGEVPAILKYSALCPLLFREAEGPAISFVAGKKKKGRHPTSQHSCSFGPAWERLAVRTSSSWTRIHLKPAGFSVMPCSALQSWVRCCCYTPFCLGSLPLLFSFFNKSSSPSFIPQSPKHKWGAPPGIAKFNLLHK